MRDSLKLSLRRVRVGWFCPLVLLALPNCTFQVGGLGPLPHLSTGDLPHSSAIFCDIEKFQDPTRRCATAEDLATGIPLASAAEALVSGQSSNVGLDYSPAAQAICGTGNPQAIDFQGSFPDGFPICLNCGQVIPVPHADSNAVCVAQCRDLIDAGGPPTPPDILAFCTANAHPSTNFPASGCFDNACSSGGTLRSDFVDPRRTPEPVVWRDLIGTSALGSSLTRTLPTTGTSTADFNAGGVSTQWIAHGDGYVEFEASESNLSHVIGLSAVPGGCAFPCTDSDPSLADVHFGISLNIDGRFYVLEGGSLITGPDINGSFGTYVAAERFRVRVKDNFDGTAVVTYSRVNGSCVPGTPCPDTVFVTRSVGAAYPFRVDTSFREQNATLANVTIVRIQ